MSTTVYISIDNSGDKLSQAEWSRLIHDVDWAFDSAVRYEGARLHGRWFSRPDEPWQDACWCAEWGDELAHIVDVLKQTLANVARTYREVSITWAEATTTIIEASPEDAP